LAIAGHLNSYLCKRLDVGLDLLRKAVHACPNEPAAWLLYGVSLAYDGKAKEGRRCAKYALSLSPCDPFAYMFHGLIALCCYADGDYQAAVRHCQRSILDNPNYATTYKVLAASLVALGEVSEARRAGARVLEIEPNYPGVAAATIPFRDRTVRELMLTRLRTAGVLPPLQRR
jgi:Flp pilus assembly protein TadD